MAVFFICDKRHCFVFNSALLFVSKLDKEKKMQHEEYKISNQTIKDIINGIPKEKWPSVMRDMEAMLTQISGTIELIKLTANELGVDSSELIDMGDSITWVDDGKCDNEIIFTDESGSECGGVKFGENGVEVK